jgi:hypothetical protein
MKKFRLPSGPAPKKLADYQFYMQHKEFKTKVTEVFNERSLGLKASKHLKVRARVALAAGEGSHTLSWIWYTAGNPADENDSKLQEGKHSFQYSGRLVTEC